MCPLVTISCSMYGFVKRFSNLTDWGLNYTRSSRLDSSAGTFMKDFALIVKLDYLCIVTCISVSIICFILKSSFEIQIAPNLKNWPCQTRPG